MEAKWQLDDQRFHIRSIRQSYGILSKRGMKMPEFFRLLNVIEEFYNQTAQLVGRKMRGEEESGERASPIIRSIETIFAFVTNFKVTYSCFPYSSQTKNTIQFIRQPS